MEVEIICDHCQQSAEKMLKAFLVYSNANPPKKHDLDVLCDMCKDIDEAFSDLFDLCDRLNPYANQPRYPFGLEITEDMMSLAVKDCSMMRDFVMSRMVLAG